MSGGAPLSMRGNCRPLVYWNGVRVSDGSVENIVSSPRELGGVEYYTSGFVPVQYRAPGTVGRRIDLSALGGPGEPRLLSKGGDGAACGVLLLWPRP